MRWLVLLQGTQLWTIALFFYVCNFVPRGKKLTSAERESRGKAGGEGEKENSLLYEVLIVIAKGFGGGILIPVLLAQDDYFPFPLGSDVVIPVTLAAFSFVRVLGQYFPGDFLYKIFFELVRAKLICAWAARGAAAVPASSFGTSSQAIMAPLVCGWLGGCGGIFVSAALRPEQGGALAPIRHGPLPWNVLSAGFATVFIYTLPIASPGIHADDVQLYLAAILSITRIVEPTRVLIAPWRWVGASPQVQQS
eukprot:g3541.t1